VSLWHVVSRAPAERISIFAFHASDSKGRARCRTEPSSPSSSSASSSARGSRGSSVAGRRVAAFGRTLSPSPKKPTAGWGGGEKRTWFGAGPRPDPVAARVTARRARRAASLETAVLHRRAGGDPGAGRLAGDELVEAVTEGRHAGHHRRTGSSGSVIDEGRTERSTSLRERFTTPFKDDAGSSAAEAPPAAVSPPPALHWSRRPTVMAKRPTALVMGRSHVASAAAANSRSDANTAAIPLRTGSATGAVPGHTPMADVNTAQTAAPGSNGVRSGAMALVPPEADTDSSTADDSGLDAATRKPAERARLVSSGAADGHVVAAVGSPSGLMAHADAADPADNSAMPSRAAVGRAAREAGIPPQRPSLTSAGTKAPRSPAAVAETTPRQARATSPLRRHVSLSAAETQSPPRPEWQEVGMTTGAA